MATDNTPPPTPKPPSSADQRDPQIQKSDTSRAANDSTKRVNQDTHSTGLREPARKALAIAAVYVASFSAGIPDAPRHDQPTRNDNAVPTQKVDTTPSNPSRPPTEIRPSPPAEVAPAPTPPTPGKRDIDNPIEGIVKNFGEVIEGIAEKRVERHKSDVEGERAAIAKRAAEDGGEQRPH